MKTTCLYLFLLLNLFSYAQSVSKYNLKAFQADFNNTIPSKSVQDYDHIIGDDALDETWIIYGDTVLNGDLILFNQGQLILEEGSSLTLNGQLVSVDDSEIFANQATISVAGHYYALGHSMMQIDSCQLTFPMDYRYQYGIFAMDTASVSIRDTDLDFANGLLEGSVIGSASLNFQRSYFSPSVTISAMGESELNVEHCINAWEFLLTDSCTASFSHSESLILWFYFPENVTASYTFPAGVWVEDMDFNETIPGLEEIPYSVSIDSCTNVNWGMFPMAGSNVTISNSDMRTCGWIFNDGGEHTVSGMMNEQFYASESFNPGDRQLNFVNSRVRTWNFYAMNASTLTIDGCFYGEALAMEDGTVNAFGGICDGSGGYLGTNHGNLNVFATQIECQLVMEGRSNGSFVNSELYYPWDEHVFAGHSIAVFANTERNQNFSVRDTSLLVDLALDSLYMQSIGELVPVSGNAQDFIGSDAPYFVSEYRLYYASADVPDDRSLIADGISGGIYQNVITHWNTNGLMPGEYVIYLQAIVNGEYDEPVEISREVNLYDFTNASLFDADKIAVFPNPASDLLHVRLPASSGFDEIHLLNALGECVLTQAVSKHNLLHTLHLNALSPGVYFLKLNDVFEQIVVE